MKKFWEEVSKEAQPGWAIVNAQTKKTFFQVCTGIQYEIQSEGKKINAKVRYQSA
jgi:maltose phosphorylase